MKDLILYVDDERVNLDSFKFAFWMHYDILLSNTTAEAYELLTKNEVKVVITDQRMPNEKGLDFIKRVRPYFPNVVYIILTGFSDMGVVVEALNSGSVYRFIMKPWEMNEMKQTLDNAIDKYGLQTENKKLLGELQIQNELLNNANEKLKLTNIDLVAQRTELEAFAEELLATTTALKDSNDALVTAKEKAEENDRLKTAFLNNLSHEIRTPLNGILGFSSLLNSVNKIPEKQNQYIDIIQQSGNQLLKILNDVLDISRIETGQIVLFEEVLCVNKLMDDLVKFYAPQFAEKKLELFVDKPLLDSDCTFKCDMTKVHQIMCNFINNSLKFTSEGNIHFGYYLKDSFFYFYVKDTGIGIEPEYHKLIFESFRQVETSHTRNYGGTGLGLSISKAFVEVMGGRVWLDSNLGTGSTFYFTIPEKH